MSDQPFITDIDVLDPETIWVDCEQGELTCTGGDRAAFMVRDGDGWVCPACMAEMIAHHDDWMRCARGY